ncbi:cupin domain-containing protein [Candidatus Sumerlaeota bacterium]|nr:cupin domain-containing protein [Candidatus Sumerlaeota bacterium]
MNDRIRSLIEGLRLEPHPEGGYYREVFRSSHPVQPDDERPSRRALTAIYFLLAAGQHSRWHRVASDEVWSRLEGDPIELVCFEPERDRERDRMTRVRLGPYGADTQPIHVVPAGVWQAARLLGEYALVSCGVAPGFEFADFRLAADDPAAAQAIRAQGRDIADLL